MIRELHDAGIRVGVATIKPQYAAEKVIESVGLQGCIDVVHGRTDDLDPRTKTDLLRAAFDELPGPRPLYVGDHDNDELAAAELGIPFARYPDHSWEQIRAAVLDASPARLGQLLAEVAHRALEDAGHRPDLQRRDHTSEQAGLVRRTPIARACRPGRRRTSSPRRARSRAGRSSCRRGTSSETARPTRGWSRGRSSPGTSRRGRRRRPARLRSVRTRTPGTTRFQPSGSPLTASKTRERRAGTIASFASAPRRRPDELEVDRTELAHAARAGARGTPSACRWPTSCPSRPRHRTRRACAASRPSGGRPSRTRRRCRPGARCPVRSPCGRPTRA